MGHLLLITGNMGKTKKISKIDKSQPFRSGALTDQLLEGENVKQKFRPKNKLAKGDDEFVDDKLSRHILEQARKQQEELEEEHGFNLCLDKKCEEKQPVQGSNKSLDDSDVDDLPDDYYDEEMKNGDQMDLFVEELGIDSEDEKAIEKFMTNDQSQRKLADIILDKITEKKTEVNSQLDGGESIMFTEMDERVICMYKEIKNILSKYRSGKLPKAFKIIPSLSNWEQVLSLTEPETWTAAAIYQATRIFASNMNPKMAQRFFNLVLLPRIRDDIAEFGQLNFHLYQALKKSLFKPAAFFKGIILPICESGTCTLREGIIVASVLYKCSIPMLHSAAALLKIAEMDYNGANSIFMRTLLDKKYALPYRVVDAIVHHFIQFTRDKRELPVLWHQNLLTFVIRYKGDISSDQKDAIYELLKVHEHHQITDVIRSELMNSKCRDVEDADPKTMDLDLT